MDGKIATLPETKTGAEKSVAEYKEQLTSADLVSARSSSADSLDVVARDIFAQGKAGKIGHHFFKELISENH